MKAFRKVATVLGVLLVVAIPTTVWAERQNIYDSWRLHGFSASPPISHLADQDTMTDYSRKLFYVMHAELDSKSQFNDHCRENEQTIVLGCHVSGQGIYLLKVDDTRLNGVEQVTAAHEMLHEAYERLSSGERAHIDKLVVDTYQRLNDDRLNKTIALYRQQDPSVVPNELHSILGTEYPNLPTELENYYTRYFKSRQAVVGYSQQYEAVFDERRDAVNQYDAQLSSLKTQIDGLQAQLTQQETDLDVKRKQLDGLSASGNKAAYNAAVPGFNSEVQTYNAGIDQLHTLVAQYNQIVASRNAIASEEEQLVQAIDSREQPQTQK